MAKRASSGQKVSATGVVALILVILAAGLITFLVHQSLNKPQQPPIPQPQPSTQQEQPAAPALAGEQEPVVIDYNKVDGEGEQDADMASLMEERKAKYGVGESLDLIVNENESIKVGEYTISMKQIMDDVKVSRGEIVVDEINPANGDASSSPNNVADQNAPARDTGAFQAADLPQGTQTSSAPQATSGGTVQVMAQSQGTASSNGVTGEAAPGYGAAKPPRAQKGRREFGVYVVQPGDNIWNIHFRLLDEFFAHQGVRLSPLADEPSGSGFSSGVGKILKFSENMVAIYNLKTRQVDQDLNLIQPLSKVVVYNMTHVFDLLRQIDYSQVNMIQFDGDTLWLPIKD
ncbi:MAG: hypothetical protein JEZ02_06205 [Desulfatibacillum sp.]|nr:hypothetical protein [Desulfatibacillum sp.]